jgi:hypothetical protein
MNDASWVFKHKDTLRRVILTLFIIVMLGPWMFDRVHVPAEYDCDKPFIRLDGDSCGYPMSGFLFFFWFIGGFFSNLAMLVSDTFTSQSREFLMGLSLLPIIPFFTTLLFVWKKETHRLQTINLIAWTLALIPTLTVFISQINGQAFRLWGLWLYIFLAVGAIVVEMLIQKVK